MKSVEFADRNIADFGNRGHATIERDKLRPVAFGRRVVGRAPAYTASMICNGFFTPGICVCGLFFDENFNVFYIVISPKGTQTIANRAIAACYRSRRLVRSQLQVSTMAFEGEHLDWFPGLEVCLKLPISGLVVGQVLPYELVTR